MQYRWIGKNIDLHHLAEEIEIFFKNRKFKTRLDERSGVWEVMAVFRKNHDVKSVIVKVLGSPADFIVDFSAGEHARSTLKFGSLLSLFGGGIFFLKSQQTVELYQKLEDEFRRYLDEIVAKMAN